MQTRHDASLHPSYHQHLHGANYLEQQQYRPPEATETAHRGVAFQCLRYVMRFKLGHRVDLRKNNFSETDEYLMMRCGQLVAAAPPTSRGRNGMLVLQQDGSIVTVCESLGYGCDAFEWGRSKLRHVSHSRTAAEVINVMGRLDVGEYRRLDLEALYDAIAQYFPHWILVYDPEVAPLLAFCRDSANCASPAGIDSPQAAADASRVELRRMRAESDDAGERESRNIESNADCMNDTKRPRKRQRLRGFHLKSNTDPDVQSAYSATSMLHPDMEQPPATEASNESLDQIATSITMHELSVAASHAELANSRTSKHPTENSHTAPASASRKGVDGAAWRTGQLVNRPDSWLRCFFVLSPSYIVIHGGTSAEDLASAWEAVGSFIGHFVTRSTER